MEVATQELVWGIFSIFVGAIVIALWILVVGVLRFVREQERWKWAEGFVRTAENMLEGQDGQAKREWVMAQLTARFPRLDTTAIRTMLEDAVSRMNESSTP